MAYKVLFFYLGCDNMKEIGESLKEARDNIGLSIEEVANDLKLRPSQLEAIETGNSEAFKDVFYLKSLIKDYSKYLGLNPDELIDEFNEYLFDHTSRISLEEIKKANKKVKKKEKKVKRVASPYTLEKRLSFSIKYFLLFLVIVLVVIGSILVVKHVINDQPKNTANTIIGG